MFNTGDEIIRLIFIKMVTIVFNAGDDSSYLKPAIIINPKTAVKTASRTAIRPTVL